MRPDVVAWLAGLSDQRALSSAERVSEAAASAGVLLEVDEARQVAALLGTLGPGERLERATG